MFYLIVILLLLGVSSLWWAARFWLQVWVWFSVKQTFKLVEVLDEGGALVSKRSLFVTSGMNMLVALSLSKVIPCKLAFASSEQFPFIVKFLLARCGVVHVSDIKSLSCHDNAVWCVSVDQLDESLLQQKDMCFLAHVCGAEQGGSQRRVWLHRAVLVAYQQAPVQGLQQLRKALSFLGMKAWRRYAHYMPTIAEAWLHCAKRGGGQLAVADSTGVTLSYSRMLVGVMCLQKLFRERLEGEQSVGVCLPPSVAGATTLMTLFSLGKRVVNLNYTASKEALASSIEEAGVRYILTSKRFEANLEKKGFLVREVFNTCQVIYLEDFRRDIGAKDKLLNLMLVKGLPLSLLKKKLLRDDCASSDLAIVLFSSGSEGKPKGVMLTHQNIVANARQAAAALEVARSDVMMSMLPTFHVFGLTATTILPLIEGIPMVAHPDPRDAVALGHLVQQYQATILCGTSTFFRLYTKSKSLKADMFRSLRIVVAGAEKLLPEVRDMFAEKFGKTIYEGYGTTELSPVVAANVPDTEDRVNHKPGTIGRCVPGCAVRIADPDTLEELPLGEGGMLQVAGPNVMQGYLNNPEKSAEVLVDIDGVRWYQTGDKAQVDEEGFIKILDRYSRFAKLGGEMVSLGAVEQKIKEALQNEEVEILAVAIPDVRKGEVVVLMFVGELSEEDMKAKVVASGLPNLMRPQYYLKLDALPKLGTGKTDFSKAKQLAQSHFG